MTTTVPKPSKAKKKPAVKKAKAKKKVPARKALKKSPTRARTSRGSELLPDMGPVAAVGDEVHFWVGLMPSVTCPAMTVGGLSVQHTSYRIKFDKDTNVQRQTPLIGQVFAVTRSKLAGVKDELKRLVFRFEEAADEVLDYTGEDLDIMDEVPPRRARPIMIPTVAHVTARRKNGFAAHEYFPQPLDEPGIDHIFMVPCANQDRPRPGADYPAPLSVTGLYWPGEEPTEDTEETPEE